jgi:SRSO17 transposase
MPTVHRQAGTKTADVARQSLGSIGKSDQEIVAVPDPPRPEQMRVPASTHEQPPAP